MAYWRLHYHLVWGTYKREPFIDEGRERMIFGVIYQKAKELELIVHAAGCTQDHIHVILSIPPKIAVADCVRHFKGASAYAVNQMPGSHSSLKWQEGYGALSLGGRSLPIVCDYARNQKQHHCDQSEIAIYERITDENDGPVIISMK